MIGDSEYAALVKPLPPPPAMAIDRPESATVPIAIVLRSRTERMRTLSAIQTGLAVVARRHGAAGRRRQLRRRAHDHAAARRRSPTTCVRSRSPAT